MNLRRALTRNRAETRPAALDPRLRGRTYAIPFEQVWNGSVHLATGGLARWRIIESDDEKGVIKAESKTFFFRFVDDVTIRIGLDADAQTRVDMVSASRVGHADLGTNTRRIGRFLNALDQRLAATPQQILDVTARTAWTTPAL